MDKVRSKLAALAGHAAVAAQVDARIAEQAAARIDAITKRLDEIRTEALSSTEAEDEYLRLVHERGELQQVIGAVRR